MLCLLVHVFPAYSRGFGLLYPSSFAVRPMLFLLLRLSFSNSIGKNPRRRRNQQVQFFHNTRAASAGRFVFFPQELESKGTCHRTLKGLKSFPACALLSCRCVPPPRFLFVFCVCLLAFRQSVCRLGYRDSEEVTRVQEARV